MGSGASESNQKLCGAIPSVYKCVQMCKKQMKPDLHVYTGYLRQVVMNFAMCKKEMKQLLIAPVLFCQNMKQSL